MKRTSFADMACPVAQSLEQIGEWWTLLILRDAFKGVRRFADFQSRLGIARNVLADRLRGLVANGVLERKPGKDDAREVEYRLTPKGKDLLPVMIALAQWGERWIYDDEAPVRFVERETGIPIQRLAARTPDGRELGIREIAVEPVANLPADGDAQTA